MSIITLILVYTVVWWLIFFMALPFGHRNQSDSDDGHVLGTPESAPDNPNLKVKAIWTSVITAGVTLIYYLVVVFDLITIRPPVT